MFCIHPNLTAMNLTLYNDETEKQTEILSQSTNLAVTQRLVQLKYTCQCCGLQSRPHKKVITGYIEVFALDGRLTALCTMCMQAIHLSRKHQSYNHGLIIYCPSLSQGQLSRLAQMLYLAKLRNSPGAEYADQLINDIQSKGVTPLAQTFPGLKTGALSEFINLWQYASPKIHRNSQALFGGLRYWPFEMPFRHQVQFWQVATFNHLTE